MCRQELLVISSKQSSIKVSREKCTSYKVFIYFKFNGLFIETSCAKGVGNYYD